jgi:hypothetical protein
MKDSKIRANIGVSDIGWSLSRDVMFFSFGIGTTVAVFQTFGKTPSSISSC